MIVVIGKTPQKNKTKQNQVEVEQGVPRNMVFTEQQKGITHKWKKQNIKKHFKWWLLDRKALDAPKVYGCGKKKARKREFQTKIMKNEPAWWLDLKSRDKSRGRRTYIELEFATEHDTIQNQKFMNRIQRKT